MNIAIKTIGAASILFGIHQVTKPHTWQAYVPKPIERLSPLPLKRLIQLHGLSNIAVGSSLITRDGQTSLVVATAWWLNVLPLCSRVEGWRTGVRDACIVATLLATLIKNQKD